LSPPSSQLHGSRSGGELLSGMNRGELQHR